MVDLVPMVDPMPMVDPIPMVDPNPMSAITIAFDAGYNRRQFLLFACEKPRTV